MDFLGHPMYILSAHQPFPSLWNVPLDGAAKYEGYIETIGKIWV